MHGTNAAGYVHLKSIYVKQGDDEIDISPKNYKIRIRKQSINPMGLRSKYFKCIERV